jgi:hypothetical protein
MKIVDEYTVDMNTVTITYDGVKAEMFLDRFMGTGMEDNKSLIGKYDGRVKPGKGNGG